MLAPSTLVIYASVNPYMSHYASDARTGLAFALFHHDAIGRSHMKSSKHAAGEASDSGAGSSRRKSGGLSDEERAAMAEHVRELKAAARRGSRADPAEAERAVLAKIAEMPEPDRTMAERIHAIIKASAPSLSSRTWYGMPAYEQGGNVVCFFQGGHKFKARYALLGFSDKARLDDGLMWPTSYAIRALSAAVEAQIAALVKQATHPD
jgi:uncharacterized protein YdhG (YjbR/CyaY superfamily)